MTQMEVCMNQIQAESDTLAGREITWKLSAVSSDP